MVNPTWTNTVRCRSPNGNEVMSLDNTSQDKNVNKVSNSPKKGQEATSSL